MCPRPAPGPRAAAETALSFGHSCRPRVGPRCPTFERV
jgi:hypothetical protein